MGLKSALDFICGINTSTNFIFSFLPLIYSIITIIFIILGIVGVIAFALGHKFKNLARNVYGLIHLITTFISMLIIFNITYCSMVIPSNSVNMESAASEVDYSSPIRKSTKNTIGATQQEGGNNIQKIITKIFDFINNLLENNSVPFIIVQVLCTSIIVIIITFMSSIFKGISKAGYDMHCTDSNQVFNIPWWGKLVDFFMHLFLIISSIAVVLYFILRLVKDGFSAVTSGFGLKSCDTKPMTIQDAIASVSNNIDNPDVQQAVIEVSYALQEWPVMRAIFVITLSYYIIQLFLTWFEDVISNNIVLLSSWQKRETECSDEPNKQSKTNMERGFILFCNILLFILLVVITLALVVAHIYFSSIITKVISLVIKYYTPAAATLSVPLTPESVKKTISDVTHGQVNVNNIQTQVEKALVKATDRNGEIDLEKINLDIAFKGMGDAGEFSGFESPFTKNKNKRRGQDKHISKNGKEIEEREEEDYNRVDSKPPVSEPPASEPPASKPSASEPPASEPPASEPPASEPPASEPPASEPPNRP